MPYTAPYPEPYDQLLGNLPLVLMEHDAPEYFGILLQGGFDMPVPEPCTLREFLCELVGVCGVYTEKSLQTIFLDGKAIDDLDRALLGPSSRLALSAAMPGLVGATMRRGGYYSRMREGISQAKGDGLEASEKKPFRLHVRLYNAVGRELAGLFLHHGIFVSSESLLRFLKIQPPKFFDHLQKASLAGAPLPIGSSAAGTWQLPGGDIALRVTSERKE
ncbi:hypothetical protein SAMN05660653_00703 [Desulfonatronum thiosulfatophilum]|uniref:Uncharacterized protein n=1 Tax=Desulfonatronum thiosulfatophilum TaxID=617002 RepID=A0A1G6B0E6_9BACT|nr:hypothetical protein [Desulfonatronum thiosulfatophilum]SDB14128.1 hypothetical protein SAMN05660653_00703 [Desulfonatronum thiosulfatophilum]